MESKVQQQPPEAEKVPARKERNLTKYQVWQNAREV